MECSDWGTGSQMIFYPICDLVSVLCVDFQYYVCL